jgi:hypothetical protein
MKKLLIGMVVVLASAGMTFAANKVVFQDISIDAGGTGVMNVSIQGADMTPGFSLYLTDLTGSWVTGVAFSGNAAVWGRYDDTALPPMWIQGISSNDNNPKSVAAGEVFLAVSIAVPGDAVVGSTVDVMIPFIADVGNSYYTLGTNSVDFDLTDVGSVMVTPEPVSALLLGLGGLFLRRRR